MTLKKSIKFIIPSVLVFAAIGFGFNLLRSDEGINQTSGEESLVSQAVKTKASVQSGEVDFSAIDDNSSFLDTVSERLNFVSGRNDLTAYDEKQILAAINDPRIWDFSTQVSPNNLPLDASEKEDGRAFFNANPARVAVSIPGDVLEIALPGIGEPFLLEVDKAGVSANGLLSLSGTLDGEQGTFNITQGDNLFAGHINTSTNTYSFEVFGETGWIHESGALFTGELPPVVDTEHAVMHSALGEHGEHIIAKGNNEKESAIDIKTPKSILATEE